MLSFATELGVSNANASFVSYPSRSIYSQLTASDINFAVVRPLVLKYAKLRNMAIIYACMVVRSYFLTQAALDLAHSSVMCSRATLCEIMALKLLNHFATSKVQLVAVLTTPWNPLAGAPPDVVEDVKETVGEEQCAENAQSAIEMAIATKAKAFIASPIVQNVVNDIYTGRIVFTITANRSIVADNYKQRAIEMYDVRKAHFLDHYRLRVPRYSSILHFMNIAILLLIFVIFLQSEKEAYISLPEAVFLVFAVAFALQEYTGSREYGWCIYFSNVWNVFDTSFVVVFLVYLGLRIKGLIDHNPDTSQLAFDILACAGCILVPRLAFFAITNNVVILALRAMISEFLFFICIAAACFSGLLLTLHTIFLISILSNTAARIDARYEMDHCSGTVLTCLKYLFQHTVATIEGVKSDALFSYQPPFNILALLVLKPASYCLSPRQLHSANVFLIKLTSFPILIVIALYERQLAARENRKQAGDVPRQIRSIPMVEYLFGSQAADLYDVIFQVEDSRNFNLFNELDHEEDSLPSAAPSALPTSPPRSPFQSSAVPEDQLTVSSPRRRKISTLTPLEETSSNAQVVQLETTTSIARLFNRFKPTLPSLKVNNLGTEQLNDDEGLQRLRALLEECRELPVTRLRDEMKELQVRGFLDPQE
ncbi:hypothetical protein ID866_5586 [Astraeus odoratus]|nr:hypothetical protein ID866_5586 [Astraeus odoratus]